MWVEVGVSPSPVFQMSQRAGLARKGDHEKQPGRCSKNVEVRGPFTAQQKLRKRRRKWSDTCEHVRVAGASSNSGEVIPRATGCQPDEEESGEEESGEEESGEDSDEERSEAGRSDDEHFD